jgi:hypothetical protein
MPSFIKFNDQTGTKNFKWENLKERDFFEDLRVDGRIILK